MLGHLLKPEYEELIQKKDWEPLREAFAELDPPDIAEILEDLPAGGSAAHLPHPARATSRAQPSSTCRWSSRPSWCSTLATEQLVNLLNEMAPDDRTRLFEELPAEVTRARARPRCRPTS